MYSNLAVEIRGLSKSFGKTKALDRLDLSVAHGEVAGFLGPNGAGKSTTIRVLLGLLRADSGTVQLLGGDPWVNAVDLHRLIAYVPGDVTLWPNLTGGQAIDFLTRMRGTEHISLPRRNELIERFELDPTKKARTYSKGNRQKVALIAAFCSDAELFILDEPTSGLDPLMEKVFQECVAEVAARGCAVLLSSHILAEVEKLCHRVTIVRAGRAVLSGSLAEAPCHADLGDGTHTGESLWSQIDSTVARPHDRRQPGLLHGGSQRPGPHHGTAGKPRDRRPHRGAGIT